MPRPRFLLLLLAGLVLAGLARAEIEFVGVLATPQKTLFALSDTTNGRIDWVETGQSFAGHAVLRFDATSDTLTLGQGGVEKRVKLKDDAKIKAVRLELSGSVSAGSGEKFEIVRATLTLDQESVFPLKDGITWRITPQRRPDGNFLYKFSVERTGADGKSEQISAPMVIARPGSPFKIRLDDLEFGFTPTNG